MSAVENTPMVMVPAADLQRIRRALNSMLANHHRRGADGLRACEDGGAAYRLCFTEEEKAMILAHGKRRVENESANSGIPHGLPPFNSYLDVLMALGDSVILEALGEAA